MRAQPQLATNWRQDSPRMAAVLAASCLNRHLHGNHSQRSARSPPHRIRLARKVFRLPAQLLSTCGRHHLDGARAEPKNLLQPPPRAGAEQSQLELDTIPSAAVGATH